MTSPETSSAAAPPDAPGAWSPARRVAFRFAFAYLVAFMFPVPEGLVDLPWNPVETGWHALVPWVGAHVLRLASPAEAVITGSGDTAYSFVKLFCTATLAIAATIVWSILDRRRTEYRALHGWLRVYVRYALALVMISYGVVKVFDLQFLFPGGYRLMETYGDSSPMGLLWTFMGFSRAYQTFAGAAELLGGLLLFSRRTTTLGALIVVGVMSNVVMMNFCYDVPVKLDSSHLVLMAGFLLVPELGRLLRFFVQNRPTEPADLGPTLTKRWQQRTRIVLKIAIIGYAVYADGRAVVEGWRQFGPGAPVGPLEGGYEVEAFARGGDGAEELPAGELRWRNVAVFPGGFARVQMTDRSVKGYVMNEDEAAGTLTLTKAGPPGAPEAPAGVLHFTRPDPWTLELKGTLEDVPLEIRLKKLDPDKTTLVSRGFHWVQQYPYNR